ncbi:MAG: hypothetical protein B7Y25_02895 [Alphaproteobacteria bacterium 16-39-46]|nr:MAG: hypothetical protein B7Y25_02895 [Alphaproteobacteria bacterium 16-39-46]OZA43477.1 MAG: hypothetical protein B7X84_03110 [Alphaproteobacteria bacterium 17-39-52]HQS84318.1 ElyC/SanA/YdcF family protein [Alphaproteobacteria bacterium]HQS94160.1 ElyC/SanA/YdcF family protein [Alphaproteobacteria bacterium]
MTFLIKNPPPLKKPFRVLSSCGQFFYFLLWSILSLIILWFLGFLSFLGYLSFLKEPVSPYAKTDVLVVLTGGKGRIITGLSLLNEDAATHLFISGVKKNVTSPEIILEATKKSDPSLTTPKDPSKMQLGHLAKNTQGNAQEVALWVNHQNMLNASKGLPPLKSIRLVTSVYHLPRSLLEFKRTLPNITLIPHPVFSSPFHKIQWWTTKSALKLSFSEYVKFNIALFRIFYEVTTPFLKKK